MHVCPTRSLMFFSLFLCFYYYYFSSSHFHYIRVKKKRNFLELFILSGVQTLSNKRKQKILFRYFRYADIILSFSFVLSFFLSNPLFNIHVNQHLQRQKICTIVCFSSFKDRNKLLIVPSIRSKNAYSRFNRWHCDGKIIRK